MARSTFVTAAAVLLALLTAPAAEAATSRRGLAQAKATAVAHSKGKSKGGSKGPPGECGVAASRRMAAYARNRDRCECMGLSLGGG